MRRIKLHDREFELAIDAATIDREIARVAGKINRDLAEERPLFLSVLNGAFMFTADLLKLITVPGAEVSFVKVASYAGTSSTGRVRELIGLDEDIAGRTVVITEDMVDTGRSLAYLKAMLEERRAGRVLTAAMFHKPAALECDVTVDYGCIALENDFVVGRGLDYDGLGRNLPDLYRVAE